MSIVKIKKVKKTVLTLKVDKGGKKNVVSVTLAKGESVKGTDHFLGTMTYKGKKKDTSVDMVTAKFSYHGGAGGDEANVELRLQLTEDNTFIAPFVTTVPDDKTQTPLHCIKVEPTEDPSSVIVKFIEPKKGEVIAYPAVYFHTSQGVIDPGVGTERPPY